MGTTEPIIHRENLPEIEAPLPTPRFGIGQRVTFVNDYGVSFPHRTITGIHFYPRPHVPVGYDVTPTDTPWFQTNEQNLYIEYDQNTD